MGMELAFAKQNYAFCFFFWKKKKVASRIRIGLFFLKKEPKTLALRGCRGKKIANG
jgi:hypothetical protein